MSRAVPTVVHAKLVPERDSAISDDVRVSTAGRTSPTVAIIIASAGERGTRRQDEARCVTSFKGVLPYIHPLNDHDDVCSIERLLVDKCPIDEMLKRTFPVGVTVVRPPR